MSNKIAVLSVISNGRKYLFRKPLTITVTHFESEIVAQNAELNIFGYGEDELIALNSFNEFFNFQYKNLVECSEESLTEGALKVRQIFLDLVEKVIEL